MSGSSPSARRDRLEEVARRARAASGRSSRSARRRDLPVAREADEVIEADGVEALERRAEARDPPGISRLARIRSQR